MPGIASATGLLEARIRPVQRPKSKHVELSGSTKPAPLFLRPFSGLFNPYPYGCSVLCNHPADCEAKDVLRRAKYSWASEGKALSLLEETDMTKTNLLDANGITNMHRNLGADVTNDASTVPEELFRKYTETDSRPLTPAPTLISVVGPAVTNRPTQKEFPVICNPQQRTMLVLDLRTNLQENETFTWHALTLEPPPTYRKTEIFISKPISRCTSEHRIRSPNQAADVPDSLPNIDSYDKSDYSKNVEEDTTDKTNKERVIRRRGKRLRKGKCRRGSTYGQQTEVRDLFEPAETQISHIGDGSRRTSVHTNNDDSENLATSCAKSNTPSVMLSSFIDADILKHLCRELDNDKVEAEFSIRRKIAFEEALRVKGENYSRSGRSQLSNPMLVDKPRVFSRQSSRFEILGSESLHGLTVLDYLSKHVFVSSGRKLIFGRTFNKFQNDAIRGTKFISPNDVYEALQDVIGKPITQKQKAYLKLMIGEINEPLNFRTWCGLCAAVERLLCPLPLKEIDPATWLERIDFETLERRLKSTAVNPKLAHFLREIHKK
ncbi:unnamed protein product [Xylocopa violacea]|uniref:Uncharacterized protein n=1 Tax=Xylocopa violacea TaxID=135666 RepID=A0ABP1MZ96_XYLVO